MRLIITCGCGDTNQFAKDAFKILHPKEEIPQIIELNQNTKSLIRLFMLVLGPESVIDKFLEDKFAIAIEVKYAMNVDIMEGEANEEVGIYVDDLIKGHELEL